MPDSGVRVWAAGSCRPATERLRTSRRAWWPSPALTCGARAWCVTGKPPFRLLCMTPPPSRLACNRSKDELAARPRCTCWAVQCTLHGTIHRPCCPHLPRHSAESSAGHLLLTHAHPPAARRSAAWRCATAQAAACPPSGPTCRARWDHQGWWWGRGVGKRGALHLAAAHGKAGRGPLEEAGRSDTARLLAGRLAKCTPAWTWRWTASRQMTWRTTPRPL